MRRIEFDGRVIAITGGGRGLGESHARELAKRGAAIVLNEIDKDVGEAVAEAIRNAGGKAIANDYDITDPDGASEVVKNALSEFGRLDGLICNAGFLRDKTFAKMTIEDFKDVVEIHLMGAVYPLHAAWPHMQAQGFGRIVFTTSSSALWGNFGQTNYDAAKLGLVGLMNAIKLEGAKFGIKANAIAPLARTRMFESAFPEDVAALLDPQQVSGLVTYLCSELCPWSGETFELGGGLIARASITRTEGIQGDFATPEAIHKAKTKIEEQPLNQTFANALDALDDLVSQVTKGAG